MKRILAAVGVLALCGCTVGPNYKRPQMALPGGYRGAPAAGGAAGSLADTKWQDLFPDPALNRMVASALEHNFDLQIAVQHVAEARLQLGITRANQYPFLDAQAGFGAQQLSSIGAW